VRVVQTNDSGGLADSIGSQESERLAAPDREADRIQRDDGRFSLVDSPDTVEFDHGQAVSANLGLIDRCIVLLMFGTVIDLEK